MQSSLKGYWATLSLLLWRVSYLLPVSASASAHIDSTHVAISGRSDIGGEIVSDADLPGIAPDSGDDSSPPHQFHISLNSRSPGAFTHPHAHYDVELSKEVEDRLGVPVLTLRSTSSFPQPFDTSLGTNFTAESCPDFFDEFLNDSSFTNCYAVSMLLRNSNAFFHTLTSAPATSHILDLACSTDVQECATVMSDWASSLLNDDNCGEDFANGNPLVTDAYTNFITYEPMYRATCLQNPDTTDYCFVDAVTNTSNPVNYDVYFLPFGTSITSAPFPTCNACLQASLDIFSNWAQVDGQPLVNSYLPSAVAINGRCGAGFANVNITVGEDQTSSSPPSNNRPTLSLIVIWAALLVGAVSLPEF